MAYSFRLIITKCYHWFVTQLIESYNIPSSQVGSCGCHTVPSSVVTQKDEEAPFNTYPSSQANWIWEPTSWDGEPSTNPFDKTGTGQEETAFWIKGKISQAGTINVYNWCFIETRKSTLEPLRKSLTTLTSWNRGLPLRSAPDVHTRWWWSTIQLIFP